jgi:hypothetical protein
MKLLANLSGLVFLVALSEQSMAASPQYKGYVLYPIETEADVGVFISDISDGGVVGSMGGHAHVWNPLLGIKADLHPANLPDLAHSQATGAHGNQQVGFAGDYAYLWNGTADSAVNLHPTGYRYSEAQGTNGVQQVGDGAPESSSWGHALLWNGSAESVVDLHPQLPYDFQESHALETDGIHQVGYAFGVGLGDSPGRHALLWKGSAASVVDLHPLHLSGIMDTQALGVSGSQQVGVANAVVGSSRAMLWNGSAASAINLHPVGYVSSLARATNGAMQVGYARRPFDLNTHAMLWLGSYDSAVDLHPLLPSAMPFSEAHEIDSSGRIYGVASNGIGDYYAVMWDPVPEPTSSWLAITCIIGPLTKIRRPRRSFASSESCIN